MSSIRRVGGNEESARNIAFKVKNKLSKKTTPISTDKIKNAVLGELKKTNPDIAEGY